jgi:hypothetical protein
MLQKSVVQKSTVVAVCCAFALATSAITLRGQDLARRVRQLSLAIPDESEPPSGIVQMKLDVTEPQPISTGGGYFSTDDVQSIDGIALLQPDAAGVAIVPAPDDCVPARPNAACARLTFTFPTDPSAGLADYPLATIAGRVRADAVVGNQTSMTIDGLTLTNFAGGAWDFELNEGRLTIDRPTRLAITDVVPGSALVPAGGVVSIFGMNFTPNTRVQFNEVDFQAIRYISPTQIDVVPAVPVLMHGMRIRLRNRRPDDRAVYFSYQRTTPGTASTDPLLALAHPVFPLQGLTRTSIALPSHGSTGVSGVALQNLGATIVSATLTLGATSVVVPVAANQRVVRGTHELFGQTCEAGCVVTVQASAPVQVIGIDGDAATLTASPILPR